MGYRTVVMLNNDYAHKWEDDLRLGKKIARAMNGVRDGRLVDVYGLAVECVHADTQTLAVLDGYTKFNPLTYKGWTTNETDEETALHLLKDAAGKLGYQLVKKRSGAKP